MANSQFNICLGLCWCVITTTTWATSEISSNALTPAPFFGNYQVKGCLSDYTKLKAITNDNKAFIYRNQLLDRNQYHKLMLDPIKVSTKRHTWPRDDSPILGDLASYFHQAIIKSVSDTYSIVNTPGPNVLRLRIAVTDLEPNDPGISLITLVVPFLWLGEASAGAAQGDVGSTPFAGQAVIEMEILDSQTNTQLAAYIERRVGKKYNWEEGIVTGFASYMKAFFTWAYTQDAFDSWANLLRAELEPNTTKSSTQ